MLYLDHSRLPDDTLRENKHLINLIFLEREPIRYCKCDGKVTFARPFQMLGKVTSDEYVNALERYWKDDILYIFRKP